jgi:hypothetical protein
MKKKIIKQKVKVLVLFQKLFWIKVRKQSEKTKAKISLFPSIPVQVFNVEKKNKCWYTILN